MLRRLGVLMLMVLLPLSAVAFRIGPVVTYVVGIILIVVAGALDGSPRFRRETSAAFTRSVTFLAVSIAVGWAIVSLAWTPAPAWRSTASLGAILLLGLAGLAALPERMRSSNLYPMPVGAGALALVAMATAAGFWGNEAVEPVRRLERVLAVLVLFAWPAIAWLRSRGRDVEALALALGTAAAAALGPGPAPIIALSVGALAHLAAQFSTRAALGIAILLAAMLVASPALVALLQGVALPAEWLGAPERWHAVLLGDPAKLLTGHGLGSLRLRPDLVASAGASLLGLWYELGIVGILALSVALVSAMARVPGLFGPLAPGVVGAVATAFVLAVADIGGGALWWPAALATVTLLFVAARRGQFRTRRPQALAGLMVKSGAR